MIEGIGLQGWSRCGLVLGLLRSKSASTVPGIGRKLLIGKKPTLVVKIISQKDGQ